MRLSALPVFSFAVLLALTAAATAAAPHIIMIRGEQARSLTEALYASDFENADTNHDVDSKNLNINARRIQCSYSAASAPDEMKNVKCMYKDYSNKPIPEPFNLAKAIEPYAAKDTANGSHTLTVEGIHCSMVYDTRDYSCSIKTVTDK